MFSNINVNVKKLTLPAVLIVCGLLLGLLISSFFKDGKCILCHTMNNTYEVGHITAKLTDGTYTERDGADSQNTTSIRIISLPVRGSINGDKYDDAAIVLESQMSGQVPSYYVGASLGARNGASPTNTIYMGDGIEILGIEVEDDIIWVFTLERRENESMDNAPTIERVRQYIMRDGALHEIA